MDFLRYVRESFIVAKIVARSSPLVDEYSADKQRKVEDYLELSEEMNRRPGVGIFRRFGTLSNLSLLYMQAELVELEEKLWEKHDRGAVSAGECARTHATNMMSLRLPEGKSKLALREVLFKMQGKLKIYHEALAHHIALREYPGPGSHDIKRVRELLGPRQTWIAPEEHVWKQATSVSNERKNIKDFVVLSPVSARRTPIEAFVAHGWFSNIRRPTLWLGRQLFMIRAMIRIWLWLLRNRSKPEAQTVTLDLESCPSVNVNTHEVFRQTSLPLPRKEDSKEQEILNLSRSRETDLESSVPVQYQRSQLLALAFTYHEKHRFARELSLLDRDHGMRILTGIVSAYMTIYPCILISSVGALWIKMLLLLGLTMAFSVLLCALFSPKSAEVFAIIAAFAAVEVVFLGIKMN